MDLSTIIVLVLIGGAFFGFIIWMAIHSRRADAQKLPANNAENKLRSE